MFLYRKLSLQYLLLSSMINLVADDIEIQFIMENSINFQHQTGAEGDFHLPETIGAGLAWLDYDMDGFIDLYCVNSGYWTKSQAPSADSKLYRNLGNGNFVDVTNQSGLKSTEYGQGVTVADYDNDGDPDLYLTNFGSNQLYQNRGDGTFIDITLQSGVSDPHWSTSAAFLDIDLDGFLDLFVVNYLQYSIDDPVLNCGVEGNLSYCHPSLFAGAADQLYYNNGDGTFSNITKRARIDDGADLFNGKGLGVVAGDFNRDGWPDIYVANDDTANFLFYNRGGGVFNEVALMTGCAYSFDGIAQAGMGVDVADLNKDGWLDIFVTNLSYETNALYYNNGDGTFNDVIYQSRLANQSFLYVGFATGLYDFDNDNDIDIFIANGHVIHNIDQTSEILTASQPNQLFVNVGDGTFREVSKQAGKHFNLKRVSRGAAFGDYDNDGDIDVAVSNSGQRLELLRNETSANWIRIKTIGTVSNRDGIGCRVSLQAGKEITVQEVHRNAGYLSSHDPRLHFGLNQMTNVDRLEVQWLSGLIQVFENIPANQEFKIIEPKLPAQLLWASKHGNLSMAELVLENRKIDIDIVGRSGNTPLLMAVEGNHLEVIKLLINKGANPNQQNKYGNTALILACSQSTVEVVLFLLSCQVEVNHFNQERETALMYSAWRGNSKLVCKLLDAGAEVGPKNLEGETAISLAKSAGHHKIIKILDRIKNRKK